MYKVLIADDEEIILKSITTLIDWDRYGLYLAGSAKNGLEAYEMILRDKPDIVITDIKMPGMNGLELMEKVRRDFPDILFIILSGYGEFDFASKAIQYGVKHYLLKPCDEDEIIPVLIKVTDELKQKEKKEELFKSLESSLQKVLPQVKEQFLRDLTISGQYNERDYEFFKKLFNISSSLFKIALFKIENSCDFVDTFALKNIAEEIIGERVSLSAIVDGNVLFLIQTTELSELNALFENIRKEYFTYFYKDISMAVSYEGLFEDITAMYREARECLKYVFYLGEGAIVTVEDINPFKGSENTGIVFDYDKIAGLVKAGNIERLEAELKLFFQGINPALYDIDLARSYCMELYLSVARQCSPEKTGEYTGMVSRMKEMVTLKQISEFIRLTALEIAGFNYKNTRNEHSLIIARVIRCIEENIQNPDLSLTWIAKDILYMNENYLGKLFAKEMQEKFSQYVMRIRMEKAKGLFESAKDYKIYEVCQMTGFLDSTQYFSQVFKKHTGYTPSEYKKMKMQ